MSLKLPVVNRFRRTVPDAEKGKTPVYRGFLYRIGLDWIFKWWRRGESNPRPKTLYSGPLRAFPVIWISSSGTPAGRVPVRPSRLGFRPSSPREGDLGYPVRATPFRLHGQSAVGRTRLLRPRKRSYSRWRLLVPAFYEVRGASARNPGASTSPSKPFRPRD